MSRRHTLKCWPEPFEAIDTGKKTFEIRKDDRPEGFRVGDILILREYNPRTEEFSGRIQNVVVSHVLEYSVELEGLLPGYVCMAIEKVVINERQEPLTKKDGRLQR